MVTLLRKIFIKDYKNVTNEKNRNAHGKLAAAFGIVSNAFLFAIKLAFGILANSVSIIADSVNNLSDFGNSTITLVGFKMANKPADKEHPFGHQRIEYISGLMVSIVIVALAILLMYNSIVKIVSGDSATYDIISFIILGVAVVLKGLNRAYKVEETRNFVYTRILSFLMVFVNVLVMFLTINIIIFGKVIITFLVTHFGLSKGKSNKSNL